MFGLGVHAEYLFGVFHVHVVVDSIVAINVVVYYGCGYVIYSKCRFLLNLMLRF